MGAPINVTKTRSRRSNGFAAHLNTIATQIDLFDQLAPALQKSSDDPVAADVASKVVTFTVANFNRTFIRFFS